MEPVSPEAARDQVWAEIKDAASKRLGPGRLLIAQGVMSILAGVILIMKEAPQKKQKPQRAANNASTRTVGTTSAEGGGSGSLWDEEKKGD